MLLNVSLCGVSSYSPDVPTVLGPLKKINLIYGQNGAGKSTIGNYLQTLDHPSFGRCSISEQAVEPDICVYNQAFIEKNFHSGSQPGVFTLNEDNVEAEKSLRAAEAAIEVLEADYQTEMTAGIESKAAQEALEQSFKDGIWALRKQVESTALGYCLQGFHTKDRMLEKVTSLAFSETPDTFEELVAEANELVKANDQPIPSIPKLSFWSNVVEKDRLLQELIIASDESYLSALILDLGNSDWVKQSFEYLDLNAEQCPLCQQKLSKNFYDDIKKVFDKTYEERLVRLQKLRLQYSSGMNTLIAQIDGAEYPTPKLAQMTGDLKALLVENLSLIDNKVSNPSIVVKLSSSDDLVEGINQLIEVEQVRINAFNAKLREKAKHLAMINERFWYCYRDACDELIQKTLPKVEAFREMRIKKRESVQAMRDELIELRKKKAVYTSQTTNIDQAVDNINRWLALLGLQGFELVKEEGPIPQYRLQRAESKEKVFATLSEGEKTLISFLYFLEVCNGELDSASKKHKSQRIVVIDDPISSLSHNYVYDVASLIRKHVLLPANRFKQVIVLTHNLFFYHELIKLIEDDRRDNEMSLFKVSKANHSNIQPLQRRDIQNDYHAFWHTIKDALEGRASPALIPNMMRNVLEYYFGFVQRKEKLWKVIDSMSEENPEFRALYRYINRESHSDPVNLSEFGSIDPRQYLDQFRKIFVATDFEDHYNLMMA